MDDQTLATTDSMLFVLNDEGCCSRHPHVRLRGRTKEGFVFQKDSCSDCDAEFAEQHATLKTKRAELSRQLKDLDHVDPRDNESSAQVRVPQDRTPIPQQAAPQPTTMRPVATSPPVTPHSPHSTSSTTTTQYHEYPPPLPTAVEQDQGYSRPVLSLEGLAMQMNRMQQMQDWLLQQKEMEVQQLRHKLEMQQKDLLQKEVEIALLKEKLSQQEERLDREVKLVKLTTAYGRQPQRKNPTSSNNNSSGNSNNNDKSVKEIHIRELHVNVSNYERPGEIVGADPMLSQEEAISQATAAAIRGTIGRKDLDVADRGTNNLMILGDSSQDSAGHGKKELGETQEQHDGSDNMMLVPTTRPSTRYQSIGEIPATLGASTDSTLQIVVGDDTKDSDKFPKVDESKSTATEEVALLPSVIDDDSLSLPANSVNDGNAASLLSEDASVKSAKEINAKRSTSAVTTSYEEFIFVPSAGEMMQGSQQEQSNRYGNPPPLLTREKAPSPITADNTNKSPMALSPGEQSINDDDSEGDESKDTFDDRTSWPNAQANTGAPAVIRKGTPHPIVYQVKQGPLTAVKGPPSDGNAKRKDPMQAPALSLQALPREQSMNTKRDAFSDTSAPIKDGRQSDIPKEFTVDRRTPPAVPLQEEVSMGTLPSDRQLYKSVDDDNRSVGNTVASSTYGEDRQKVVNQNLLDPYGDKGIYTGIVLRSTGMPHGRGRMVYEDDGRSYEGDWRHGRWHGYGRATFANGDSFEGEYRFDQRHGRGIYQWNDGRQYDGDFSEDKRHGKGIFRWPDGAIYEGDFCQGQREGHGQYTFSDGGHYTGEWVDGRYEGYGVCTWEDGRVYKGEWKQGMAHGQGTETHPDGRIRHEGQWIHDDPVRSK